MKQAFKAKFSSLKQFDSGSLKSDRSAPAKKAPNVKTEKTH